LEVVLGASQVQGEGVFEEAQARKCAFQSVDGAGGGGEDVVEVVGGDVVGGPFGDGVPFSELLRLQP
jgi:hypothetical protein